MPRVAMLTCSNQELIDAICIYIYNMKRRTSPKKMTTVVKYEIFRLLFKLYQNACKSALDTRHNKLIPSSVLRDLLMTVLKFNTMKFGERFFHQIKGTFYG